MLSDSILFYSVYCSTIFICLKLIKHPLPRISTNIYIHGFCFVISLLSMTLKSKISSLTYIIPLFLIWGFVIIISSYSRLSILYVIISFGLSYSLWAISTAIVVFLCSPIRNLIMPFSPTIYTILAAMLFYVFTKKLINTKRFQIGIPLLSATSFINFTIIISLVLIPFLMYRPTLNHNIMIMSISLILFIILLIFIIHWWQAQITKSYKQALLNRELESLRMELEEKEKQLREISAHNEELGRLIHKDNKRIPAMEHAVSEFLIMDLDDKETVIERGNTLLLEIQKLSADRNAIVTEIYTRKYKHHDTGIAELDTMLNYMEKRAYGEHIKLSVQTAVDLHDMVPNTISAEDLSHVLSDLLENAIIATKGHTAPIIQLQFYRTGKDFILEIADNGTPFEATSLVNFGLEPITTHADTGGSGIGLMDIWKAKEKYNASLHISEYDTNAPYTKKIALIFNKKNRYTISTTRKEELTTLCKRTDLQIF